MNTTDGAVNMKTAQITVSVKTVPHPDPQRLVDAWAKLVISELAKQS